MLNRIAGVLTLRSSAFRQIADDESGTGGAFLIVVIVLLITGFVNGFVRVNQATQTVTTNPVAGVASAIVTLIFGVIGWAIGAWVLTFVAKRVFRGKTKTVEMLRVTGYVHIFDLVGILILLVLFNPGLGWIAAIVGFVVALIRLIAYIIGVREAAEFSTGNAIVSAILAAIVEFLIAFVALLSVLTLVLTALGVSGTLNP